MDLKQLFLDFPMLNDVVAEKEFTYFHEKKGKNEGISYADMIDAKERLDRFMPYIKAVYPETVSGIIESPFMAVKNNQNYTKNGKVYMKRDDLLPISGSVKARGGIYEVLKLAESIAIKEGLLELSDDYSKLENPEFKELFSRYHVLVGSTGNLGLSIGIMGRKLGFNTTVHMSVDARQWKKDLLRQLGANVIEHEGSYSKAVEIGRKEAENDDKCHFVDDENSKDLFFGYSVAALRLKADFERNGIVVDDKNKLYVYIPCGVGGAPGGIAWGLKELFGDNVHIYFCEPTKAPCMMIGLMTGLNDKISCEEIGITGMTAADGLNVTRVSKFVGNVMTPILDGVFTVCDEKMFKELRRLKDLEDVRIEPSATCGFFGPDYVTCDDNSTHVIWLTGGSMVPDEEYAKYYNGN